MVTDLWDSETPANPRRGIYIAVSGNTAAGKSSLIAGLLDRLNADGIDAMGINERSLHHHYLKRMFAAPDDFAFPIQVSFMINRHLVLLRQLVELGRTVIIERSHLDDVLFVNEHHMSGAISDEQRTAYLRMAEVLHQRIPAPDVLVLMNPPPHVSLQRLTKAEETGERPREFPDEAAKSAWVHRWYDLYTELHRSFRDMPTTIVDIGPDTELPEAVALVHAAIRRVASSHDGGEVVAGKD